MAPASPVASCTCSAGLIRSAVTTCEMGQDEFCASTWASPIAPERYDDGKPYTTPSPPSRNTPNRRAGTVLTRASTRTSRFAPLAGDCSPIALPTSIRVRGTVPVLPRPGALGIDSPLQHLPSLQHGHGFGGRVRLANG